MDNKGAWHIRHITLSDWGGIIAFLLLGILCALSSSQTTSLYSALPQTSLMKCQSRKVSVRYKHKSHVFLKSLVENICLLPHQHVNSSITAYHLGWLNSCLVTEIIDAFVFNLQHILTFFT